MPEVLEVLLRASAMLVVVGLLGCVAFFGWSMFMEARAYSPRPDEREGECPQR